MFDHSHYFLTLNETLHVCRYDRASSSRIVQMHTHNKPFGSRVYNGKVLFLVQAPRSQVACLVLNVRVLQMIFVRFVTAESLQRSLCATDVWTHVSLQVCAETH